MMIDYRKMYHVLFNAITDALNNIEKGNTNGATQILVAAQQQTEEIYIESNE